ncbi:TetR/AcrR family transcriptional regulator [Amycolatopsis suaedae]|uniref:TetR family transcriptional regulator n=1 Tax=Amycolatopsis suaedae TaxID=2510978 RepID=A0A4V2ELE0_9PSEU|nr:TetR family transcriptional regulator C-terminal domain-containing protein [Amycolatopsis suaedae]RZQ61235.1 TetR family transcriptional regulator [Amycolatopsis suaedae]
MGKPVDPARRRADLAEAVLRIVHRDGVAKVSVRNVAKEAGLVQGSVRHYFASQHDLLAFSLQVAGERIRGRMGAIDPGPDLRAAVEQAVLNVLPLDEDRRAESEVWLAFTGAALSDPRLREVNDSSFDGLRELSAMLVTGLAEAGLVPSTVDVEFEADRLHALLDGLAVHGVTRPERMTAERMTAVITRHLDELCRQPR